MRRCVVQPEVDVDDAERRGWRLLTVTAYGAAAMTLAFSIAALIGGLHSLAATQFTAAVLFAVVPQLRRFRIQVAAGVFSLLALATLSVLTAEVGTGSGLTFYFPVMAAAAPMVIGVRRVITLAVTLVACVGAVLVLHFTVPSDTRVAPEWLMEGGFVANVAFSAFLAVVIVAYGLYEIARTEDALDEQHRRSEALLGNILPHSIAERLKDPNHTEIADTYDDASILFADIAGFTAMSSDLPPAVVVRFLDRLYSGLDDLVDRHGLEKIKTTGDSYLVVSGVPEPRSDHLAALARFALEMRALCGTIPLPSGQQGDGTVHLRIGMACGPVVAGVIGARKFFYDVWGDAVNVASRMESTGVVGEIQVTDEVHRRLAGEFAFAERGMVAVKGKPDQHTWFLTGVQPAS